MKKLHKQGKLNLKKLKITKLEKLGPIKGGVALANVCIGDGEDSSGNNTDTHTRG
ncbi:hypothetical protein [Aquimarina sediminis]|uniref:hypothetical protein n=1 Tax=Aquimarina sediminis TaxID=2070536 RepID=UPI0013E8C17A|nr:hypothetical protein [Aquimarina sediminis]